MYKGDNPVDKTGSELCAYSIIVNLDLQVDGSADATQHTTISKVLICFLGLTIGLRMVPGGQTRVRPHMLTEFFPKLRCKLGTPVRDHIHREDMNAKKT